MLARYFMILGLALFVTACSSTEDETMIDEVPVDVNTASSQDAGIFGEDLAGPGSGTQADLVTNVGDRIFFGTDRYDLSPEARSVLEAQAAWLNQYQNLSVSIEGHADERGTREYNLALGDRRANAVRNYLIALGVSPARVSAISYGKERPAVVGSNETSWAQNRRSVTQVN